MSSLLGNDNKNNNDNNNNKNNYNSFRRCTYKLTPHASVLVQTSTWILAAVKSSSTVFLS